MIREEFVKQRCEIDKITEEEFEKTYRVVECNCGKPYCKGFRCLDLDDLLKENEELKKQLENAINAYTDEYNLRHNSDLKLDILRTQQKEFIKYLEDEINNITTQYSQVNGSYFLLDDKIKMFEKVLQKYKEIIGDDKTW